MDILSSTAGPLIGGLIVALTAYLTARRKTRAEVEKIEAETERTRAEVTQILASVGVTDRATRDNSTPWGWYVFGSHAEFYDVVLDAAITYREGISARISSKDDPRGYGCLAQSFRAAEYIGQRLQFSAVLRIEDVSGQAGAFMRVDDSARKVIAFDDMHDRSLSGTASWRPVSIVLDIPAEGMAITFGFFLNGGGRAWMSGANVGVVGGDTPVTNQARRHRPHPVNLALSERVDDVT
ncbi:hypothetical protein [Streptomyces brasiliscabiei]|uniref:hypothetical protein n=1 Tax=Streptomyces brasiliscabiei TaxID=2736302 RepID=UPI001C119465|nr:hypothetical protein [Streptomyces brasiliscabiei]